MTLKVIANGANYNLGPGCQKLETIDNITISWSGDGSNVAEVLDHNGRRIGHFKMPRAGFSTEVKYSVHVAPIELGESTTEVVRHVSLERM